MLHVTLTVRFQSFWRYCIMAAQRSSRVQQSLYVQHNSREQLSGFNKRTLISNTFRWFCVHGIPAEMLISMVQNTNARNLRPLLVNFQLLCALGGKISYLCSAQILQVHKLLWWWENRLRSITCHIGTLCWYNFKLGLLNTVYSEACYICALNHWHFSLPTVRKTW
jgi:hypothetical protein